MLYSKQHDKMKIKYNKNGIPRVQQSNALGIKKTKVLNIKKTDKRLKEAYLLLIRTDLLTPSFFIHLRKSTNYLFTAYHQDNQNNSDKSANNRTLFSDFYTTYFFDDLAMDRNCHFCFKNISFDGKNKLFGSDNLAKFHIIPEIYKPINSFGDLPNQTYLAFDFEDDETETQEDELSLNKDLELEEWNKFIQKMKEHSVFLKNKFDFVFSMDIITYHALKPFFLQLHKLTILQYQMIKYEQVENIETFASILQEENQKITTKFL